MLLNSLAKLHYITAPILSRLYKHAMHTHRSMAYATSQLISSAYQVNCVSDTLDYYN